MNSLRHRNTSDFNKTWFRRHRRRMATPIKKNRIARFMQVSANYLNKPQHGSWDIGEG